MLGGDSLFNLERRLDDLVSKSPDSIAEFCGVLRDIYDTPSYREWLDSSSPSLSPYQLDPLFGTGVSFEMRRFLDSTGLINGSTLEVKIDDHLGRIHLTDGPWVPASFRVYPYGDESALICNYVKEKGYHLEADVLIDPAAGCGHHGLGLREIPTQAYYDVNPRATVFCRINSILARAERMQSGLSDLRDGMPAILKKIAAKYVLTTINMPFAIFPKADELPATLAQDGGDRGVALTFAALRAVKDWADNAPGIETLRLVLLFYSLGNNKEWEVVRKASEIFNRPVDHIIFNKEKMWRVNGVKSEPNPMPISHIRTKARCSHTYSIVDQDAAEQGYLNLEHRYQEAGFDRLGYGIIDILVRG
jgi:hypothetical protein